MEAMGFARHKELEIEAKFHNFKIKPYSKPLNLKKEEREEATRDAVNVYERMKRKHAERNK